MSRDYLPSSQPGAAFGPRRVARTLVLWVGLVVMFVGVHRCFTEPGQAADAQSSWSWSTLVPALLLLGILAFLWRRVRLVRRVNRQMEPAMMAVAEHDFPRAERLYRELCNTYNRSPAVAAVVRINLADPLMRQGKLQSAIDELIATDRAIAAENGNFRALATIKLAKLFALTGQTDLAESWLQQASAHVERTDNRVLFAARLFVARVLLLCRTEQYAQALDELEKDWNHLEATLTAHELREARIMRGFATAMTSNVRDASQASRWLGPEERGPSMRYLATQWPELEAVLATA